MWVPCNAFTKPFVVSKDLFEVIEKLNESEEDDEQ